VDDSGGEAEPTLTTDAASPYIDGGLIVNGQVNLLRTHPTLYRLVISLAAIQVALGLNFLVGKDVLGLLPFTPTFFVWGMPNWLWATLFLTIGAGQLVFLSFYRKLRLARATMAFAVAYLSFFALGTMQPALEGKGSLQLPIIYVGMVVLLVWLLLEPFINPWTAKR
jgi:hypothetical protein